MEAARSIRDAVAAVTSLRQSAGGDHRLQEALVQVKRLQSSRFAGTYADLLQGGVYAPAAAFFLEELYGDKDYARRDEQFARIAGAIETLFPAHVSDTAASLARLHAMTEDLDLQMARLWLRSAPQEPPARRYVAAWRELGRRQERVDQLDSVIRLGEELARLTRAPGLRTMLRMMRGPASAAGLGALQHFLEAGFDTFAGMARQRGAVEHFLATVRQREEALFTLLFEQDLAESESALARILGQAP
ncbi:hypothetical protein PE066_13180 [Ramlibacter tataouinensis]|uniref:FFLEELY motif protein n=1 Tax=Ramlibacter tataouinensis TaxID=94132 RepID=UPI0022F3F671|nr:hypothetical protein [Ramlibacter tataouinensis]WBY00420.1 hypothetical protein PE066_13180 [Ramlibacter tataouinensis]